MLLCVGCGNPGKSHAMQRHNIGFMAIDAIAKLHNFAPSQQQFDGALYKHGGQETKVMLFKPGTYMNNSGIPLQKIARFYKVPPSNIVVFHDELDLAQGKLHMKSHGGFAGHNGLASIGAHIGKGFRRARLGIGHPGHKSLVHSYVLSDFSSLEKQWLPLFLDALAEFFPLLMENEDAMYQNKVHLATNQLRAGLQESQET